MRGYHASGASALKKAYFYTLRNRARAYGACGDAGWQVDFKVQVRRFRKIQRQSGRYSPVLTGVSWRVRQGDQKKVTANGANWCNKAQFTAKKFRKLRLLGGSVYRLLLTSQQGKGPPTAACALLWGQQSRSGPAAAAAPARSTVLEMSKSVGIHCTRVKHPSARWKSSFQYCYHLQYITG